MSRTVSIDPDVRLKARTYFTPIPVAIQPLPNRILKKQSGVSPEMALRLSIALGRTPESWLAMQDSYDLWQIRQNTSFDNVHKVEFAVA